MGAAPSQHIAEPPNTAPTAARRAASVKERQGKLWTTDQGGEALTSDTDLTPSPATVHGYVDAGTTVRSPHSEIQTAEESVLQALISASSVKTLENKALKKASNATTSILASQLSE